jgi:DNA repair protein RadD
MKPELRHYQGVGVESLRNRIREELKRIILCCPTGGGKTVLASYIIGSARENFDAKILFVAHRQELIDQTVRQLSRFGVTDIGVLMGKDARTNRRAPVQVATIQTLSRRDPPPADIIFVDECHRSASNSYRKLIALYPDATIIGLTATPCRADGKPLKDVFQAIEIAATYKDLITDGFIVAPKCFGTPSSVAPKLEGIRTQHGDFVMDELEAAMLDVDVLGDTLTEYQKHSEGRKTVIFACTVKHSLAIYDRFHRAGVRIAHVDANTPDDVRKDIAKRLDWGQLDVVTNVGIYTEGWDQPCVKCLIMARPTKSLVLFMQMAGRALRPWSPMTPPFRSWQPQDGDSVVPFIIDQGGNIDRFGLPHEDRIWSLEGTVKRANEKKPPRCIKCEAYIRHYPCIECGFAPEVTPRVIREDVSTKLAEIQTAFVDPRKAYYDSQIEMARGRGFKPTWANYRFKEKYNEWPPWSWGQAAKEACAVDEQWKRRIVNQDAQRARWKEREAEENKDVEFDTDEDFAAWARRSS